MVILTYTQPQVPVRPFRTSVSPCRGTPSPRVQGRSELQTPAGKRMNRSFLGPGLEAYRGAWAAPPLSVLVATNTGFKGSPSAPFKGARSPAGAGTGGRDFAQQLDLGLMGEQTDSQAWTLRGSEEGHRLLIISQPESQTPHASSWI